MSEYSCSSINHLQLVVLPVSPSNVCRANLSKTFVHTGSASFVFTSVLVPVALSPEYDRFIAAFSFFLSGAEFYCRPFQILFNAYSIRTKTRKILEIWPKCEWLFKDLPFSVVCFKCKDYFDCQNSCGQ